MKTGDIVRDKVTHERYLLEDHLTGSVWNIRALGWKAFIGSINESQIELIPEEPMAHPYLTPEKIHELATDIVDVVVTGCGDRVRAYHAAKAVLEREANPPPKTRVFTVTVTIPLGKRDVTSERIKEILTDSDYDRLDPAILVAVDEVTP